MALAPPFSRHLSELLRENARRGPDQLAVISRGEAVGYQQLDERVDSLAGGLGALGVRRGAAVGLLATNRWEWLAVALAAHRLGATVSAFNTFAKGWDLEYMLAHSRTEVLVSIDRFRSRDYVETLCELVPELAQPRIESARFPALREVVFIGEDAELPAGARRLTELAGEPPSAEAIPAAGADAYVVYTSGSSARPKAVPLQHHALIENGFHIGERMELTAEDRVWVAVPLFWSFGASNALPATLTHGATLVLQEAFEPGEALDLIEEHACTAAYTLPHMTNALLRHPSFHRGRTTSLRTGLTLGSAVDIRRAAIELGVASICNIYGQTETYGNCCVTPARWPLERRAVSQGPPLPGVELRIVDPESGITAERGGVGEIQVRGYLARGYVGAEEATRAAFGEDGWYRTGDLGLLDEDGALHFEARASEMIKTGGINVAPSEVEELLARHEVVAEVAVFGVPDSELGQLVVAVVSPVAGASSDEAELRAFCRERIAAYKVPARIHIVEELPKTATGKLSRLALVEQYAAPPAATPSRPRSPAH